MSVNTPILQQILSELQGVKYDIREIRTEIRDIRTEMAVFRKDLDSLRFDFNEFKENTQYFRRNLILVQEKSDTEFFRQYLDNTIPSVVVESYSFGDFYGPRGNSITDIDGCVTLHTIPQTPNMSKYKINNSKQVTHELIRNEIFFLESKNMLDKIKFDEKVIQFYKIHVILNNLDRMNTTTLAPTFKTMISSYPLITRPNKIYFMLCANDMPVLVRMYITKINNGTLNEENYKDLTFRMFCEHPNYKLYRGIVKEQPKLRKRYDNCKTFDEMKTILQGHMFDTHRAFIDAYFSPYEAVHEYYEFLTGLLGYIFQGSVTLPSSF